MRLAVIGTGYVGLVSGACFAEIGCDVVCIDKDQTKIARLLAGDMPIYEPGLEELVARNVAAGRISFSTDLSAAVAGADAVFIAVGTPTRASDGHADLTYVYAAAEEIAAALNGYTVIVDKSTVPVGTAAAVEKIIRAKRADAKFDVCSNPEFLREGSAIDDFLKPDRVVIGANSAEAEAVLRRLYQPLSQNAQILFTSRETAELIKYAGNAFLAMKITFINEVSDLCEKIGANVQDVARGIGLDSRIGHKFLQVGPGYGGSCFPKDTLAILKTAQAYESPLQLIETTVSINETRKRNMVQRVVNAVGGDAKGKKIAILGVAFKANTDDVRESPAIDIMQSLQKLGARVFAYDPVAMREAAKVTEAVTWGFDAYSVCEGADVAVVVTEWDEFRTLELSRLAQVMANPVLIDLRNLYSPQMAADAGLIYTSLGRPTPETQVAAEPLKALATQA